MKIIPIASNKNFCGNVIFVKSKNDTKTMSKIFRRFAKVGLEKARYAIASKDYNLYIKSNADNFKTFDICAARSFVDAVNVENNITMKRKFLPNILSFTRRAMLVFENKNKFLR